jgi:hypothetical protein
MTQLGQVNLYLAAGRHNIDRGKFLDFGRRSINGVGIQYRAGVIQSSQAGVIFAIPGRIICHTQGHQVEAEWLAVRCNEEQHNLRNEAHTEERYK